jgi:hypothetical protein
MMKLSMIFKRAAMGCLCAGAAMAGSACADGSQGLTQGITTPSALGGAPGFAATLASPVAAGHGLAGAATKTVKAFHGTIQAKETPPEGEFPFLSVTSEGTGTATHLGRFDSVFSAELDLSGPEPSSAGTFIITAANGDSIHGTFVGKGTLTGTTLAIVEDATITGGTGRFAGVSGSFTVERALDQLTDRSAGSFDGTISY